MKDSNNTVASMPQGLIAWYNFKKDSKALLVTGGFPAFEVLFSMLEERGIRTEKVDIHEVPNMKVEDKYDYIILAGILEQTLAPQQLLQDLSMHLSEGGIVFIGAYNRFNLGQFVGDKDLTTGHVLDGIDNYRQVSEKRMAVIRGHSYSKAELEEMLREAGFIGQSIFSVFPRLSRPQILIKYGQQANERFDARIQGEYNSPETVYLDKNILYDDLMKNQMLHQMAEGYLFVCSKDDLNDSVTDINEITTQPGRKREAALSTIVYTNKVIKRNMYPEGVKALDTLEDNAGYLREYNVPLVDGRLNVDGYETPYIKGEILTEYLRRILLEYGKETFLDELARHKEIIEHSAKQLSYDEVDWTKFDPHWERRKADDPEKYKWQELAHGTEEDKASIGVMLERGYLDLAPINCFMTEEGPLYFDQEFYVPQLPANAIFLRTIDVIYSYWNEGYRILPEPEVLEYFNLDTHAEMFRQQAAKYLTDFINDKELAGYNRSARSDYNTIVNNRFRMDYTQEEYEKLFTDIFKDAEGKKLYIFGSGDYAKKFIEKFKDQYQIEGLIDNNKEKWGSQLEGIRIYGPEHLLQEKSGYKVFICIKFYDDVLVQLKEMGVVHIGVFDPRLEYPRPLKHVDAPTKDTAPKKYHIGYVAGVFDMFHVGHLNILRRAKEQCDYLIVGVVSDEQIMRHKKTSPVIPFEHRHAIVQACRYVDEAVMIPYDHADTEWAYRAYKFDAQFSGSDYENDPYWLATRDYLRQRGSDLVFFPYTEEVSSTMLKDKLRK